MLSCYGLGSKKSFAATSSSESISSFSLLSDVIWGHCAACWSLAFSFCLFFLTDKIFVQNTFFFFFFFQVEVLWLIKLSINQEPGNSCCLIISPTVSFLIRHHVSSVGVLPRKRSGQRLCNLQSKSKTQSSCNKPAACWYHSSVEKTKLQPEK